MQPAHADQQLAECFVAHGLDVRVDANRVEICGEGIQASTSLEWLEGPPGQHLVQLNVAFDPWPGTQIIECFAGLADTPERAVADAFEAFSRNVLHPLLGAFINPSDAYVVRDNWMVGGIARTAVDSGVLCRGEAAISAQHEAWCHHLFDFIETQALPPGTHWIRVFYAQDDGVPNTFEALLDNEPWPELEAAMRLAPLPTGPHYASVRGFWILREGGLELGRAAALIAARPRSEEASLVELLLERGADPAFAERCVAFLPSAFCRALLSDIGVTFSDHGIAWHGEGLPGRRFRLMDEPVYAEGLQFARQRVLEGPRWMFEGLCERSAEMNAINQALESGAEAEGLACSDPVFMRLGVAKPPPKRPWWKFR